MKPTNPSMAGSNVIAAATAITTASDVPTARPWRKLSPISSMPSTETMTVKPANTTARPEVVIASSTAASGEPVRCSASRYRVTMKSA